MILELDGHRHVSKCFRSRVYAALRQTDAALPEAGCREHGEWMPLVKVDQRFDTVDVRFQKLMRCVSFQE